MTTAAALVWIFSLFIFSLQAFHFALALQPGPSIAMFGHFFRNVFKNRPVMVRTFRFCLDWGVPPNTMRSKTSLSLHWPPASILSSTFVFILFLAPAYSPCLWHFFFQSTLITKQAVWVIMTSKSHSMRPGCSDCSRIQKNQICIRFSTTFESGLNLIRKCQIQCDLCCSHCQKQIRYGSHLSEKIRFRSLVTAVWT